MICELQWLSNDLAVKLTAAVDLLDRMSHEEDRDFEEALLLAYASGALEVSLANVREGVVRDCAPWFDGSAFAAAPVTDHGADA